MSQRHRDLAGLCITSQLPSRRQTASDEDLISAYIKTSGTLIELRQDKAGPSLFVPGFTAAGATHTHRKPGPLAASPSACPFCDSQGYLAAWQFPEPSWHPRKTCCGPQSAGAFWHILRRHPQMATCHAALVTFSSHRSANPDLPTAGRTAVAARSACHRTGKMQMRAWQPGCVRFRDIYLTARETLSEDRACGSPANGDRSPCRCPGQAGATACWAWQ